MNASTQFKTLGYFLPCTPSVVLAGRNGRPRSGQDVVHIAPRPPSFQAHAIRSQECTRNLSPLGRRNSRLSQVEIRARILGLHHCLLFFLRRTLQPLPYGTIIATERQCFT